MKIITIILFLLAISTGTNTNAQDKRARELGIPLDGIPGEFNAITDVKGVAVGHTTLISGNGKLEVGKGPVRTGVTAVLPRGKTYDPVFSGWYTPNGNGEMTGTTWLEESGFLEGPVMLTNTHSVGVVRDAVIEWQFKNNIFDPLPEESVVASHFGGAITVTNNGISLIPNLSLSKPAAIFDLSMGKKRLSFEPQLRFALEGKPWSFMFWWRYKLLKTEKFQVILGTHPALSFRNKTFLIDGIEKHELVTYRYLAGEIAPSYFITKNTSIGIYYLYSYGVEKVLTRNTNFVSIRAGFSNIKITDQFYLRFNPQIYYLNMDKIDGFYFNSSLTLSKLNFPFSVSSIINNPIHTNIVAGKDFLWSVSLIYTFGKDYVPK